MICNLNYHSALKVSHFNHQSKVDKGFRQPKIWQNPNARTHKKRNYPRHKKVSFAPLSSSFKHFKSL